MILILIYLVCEDAEPFVGYNVSIRISMAAIASETPSSSSSSSTSPPVSDSAGRGAAPPASSDQAATPVTSGNPDNKKVTKTRINLQAVGSAPQLKKTRFKIESDKPFSVLDTFLRSQLKLDSQDNTLFLYLCSGFCPSLSDLISTLVENFGTGQGKKRELVVQYCLQPAWG